MKSGKISQHRMRHQFDILERNQNNKKGHLFKSNYIFNYVLNFLGIPIIQNPLKLQRLPAIPCYTTNQ